MQKRLPDLEAWAIFATVAQHGSFSRAARALGLADPTVSKAIRRLEDRLGTALIARTSRRFSLTDSGRALLERAQHILREGEAAEEQALVQSNAPRGLIRLSAPLSFGTAYLGRALPAFLRAYPDITLECALSDRKVDLVAERFDLALRIASPEDSSLLSRRLCNVRVLLVGAPAYFAAHGRPTHPADLAGHAALAYTGAEPRGLWRFHHTRLGDAAIEPPVRIWTDNADVLNPALLAGQGLALQPEFLVWRELQAGSLEIAMPDWSPPALALHLLMPPSPLRPLRVQVLIDHLARELSQAPWAT